MASSSSRRRRQADGDALEEGEFVPGYCSSASDDTDDDDDDRYWLHQSRREEEIHPPQLTRRLEEILARGRAAMLPSYECESDGTISDDDGSHSPASFSAGVGAPMRRVYSCHVCGKGFGSSKAVDGHMMLHDPRERHHGKEYVAVSGGWAATGKRGWTGSKGKAVVSSSEELNHSMATVVSEPNRPLQPMPLASLARSNLSSSLSMASARTNLESGEPSSPHSIHNEPGVSAAGANPFKEAFVHQQPPQIALQLAPAVPPVQGPAAPRREYTCKICGKSYPTNQGLGGHAAGHMNRRREAEAAAGFGQDGNAIPAAARKDMQEHRCKKCDKVFATGVALGGHMRMHYNGPPIVHRKSKKRCVEPPPPPPAALLTSPTVCMADLTLTLGTKTGQPSYSSPPAASRLRLFGIDIGPSAAEAPAVQEGTDIRPQVEAPRLQEGIDTTPHAEAPQEGSAMTTEGSAPTGGQRQDEIVEKNLGRTLHLRKVQIC